MLKLSSFGRAVLFGSVLLCGSAPGVAESSVPSGDTAGVDAVGETTADASAMSRDQLIALVEQLRAENRQLRGQPVVGGESIPEEPADLRATVAAQAEQLEGLRRDLAAITERLAQLEASVASAAPPAPPEPPAFAPPPAPEGAPEPAPAAVEAGPAVGEFRYSYEFGLIRTEDSEVVVLRDEEGRQRIVRVDTNEYRDDALKLTLYFKNTSDRPLRYSGLIALGGKRSFNDDRPPVLATTTFRTPRLQPGEVFDLSREVDVDRPWRVDVVELGKVRSYPDRP